MSMRQPESRAHHDLDPPPNAHLVIEIRLANASRSIASSTGMMRVAIATMNKGITSHGERLPRLIARPVKASTIPTYIGLRLKRNGPPVTRLVETPPGFIVVFRLRNAPTAGTPNARPTATGIRPSHRE